MSTLEFTVLGLDFPVGSMNKTPTLATGEQEAMPVNAGPTREHRRLAAKTLYTGLAVFTSAVPAEAVRRPYAGNIPAPTQKGLRK